MTLHPADWLARLPGAGGARYVRALRHGSMELELYAPRGAGAPPRTQERASRPRRGSAS